MTDIRSVVRALSTAPLFAHLVAIGSLLTWIVKATWLDFVKVDSHILVGLGHVVDGLLSAIIAGYVFYIVFAIYPELRERRRIAPFLFGRVRNIVGDCLGVIDMVNASSGKQIAFKTASDQDVLAAFTTTATAQPPNILSGDHNPPTWPGFFLYRYQRTLTAIEELFQQGRFLDAELIELLTSIRAAHFYRMSLAVGSMPVTNPTLDAWGPSFYRYMLDCRRLAEWHDRRRLPDIPPFLPTI